MQLRLLFAILGCFVNLSLALLVIYKNRHNAVHRIYFLLSIILACFNFSLFFFYQSLQDIFWKRMVYMNASVMPSVAYHFFISLIDKNNDKYKKIAWSGYILGIFFLTFVLTPFFIPNYNAWENTFMCIMFPFPMYGIYLLYKESLDTNYLQERIRLRLLSFGALIILLIGALDYIFEDLNLSSVSTTLYSLLASYAIFKHRLMNITLLARKIITIIIMSIFIVSIFLININFIGKQFDIIYFSLIFSTILSIIIFEPVKSKVVFFLEKNLFKKRFAYQKIIFDFNNDKNKIVDENILYEKIISAITSSTNIKKILIYLKKSNLFILTKSSYNTNIFSNFYENSDLIQCLNKYQIISQEELDRFLKYENISNEDRNVIMSTIQTLNKLNIENIFSISSNNNLLGFIAIGLEKDDNFITSEEIEIILMLSKQVASCLENINLQKELYASKEMALLGKLATGIAHEVKNPLSAIKGAAQYLKTELNENKLNSEFADIIIDESNRLNDLVMEFLLFARPQKLEKKDSDINQLIINILKIIKKEERFSNINFIENLSTNLPEIKIDNNQIKQVLFNLILNATEACKNNGIIEIISFIENDKKNIIIEIKDSGIGIPNEIIHNIFDPFFTTKKNGTGLGLAIVNQIILNHNGVIAVESVPGNTKFIIALKVS